MCGICGVVTKKNLNIDILKKMNNTMEHRGPDDGGEIIYDDNETHIGLAQRRLSILDLSYLGHQPMESHSKNSSIVFNGEIYNYIEIRENLKKLGYTFNTNCDTEVVLVAYEHYGVKCLDLFNGMFAFAIYDKKEEQLFCARDRFGKKPFYYYYNNQELVFASELKPIMTYPNFRKEINTEVLGRYLKTGYINAPDTIFKNTYKLEPGKYFFYRKGQVKIDTYWNAIDEYYKNNKNLIKDYNTAKMELDSIINKSVKLRMISDVPLGTFLSGGIDSTLVTAYAQKNSTKPINTYCIGFDEEEYNEANFARETAKYLGTNHSEVYINEEEMLSQIETIPKYYDEPFGDSSQIPTMLVSKLAKRDITVALTGDGGDEIFCGYGSYDLMKMIQKLEPLSKIVNFITINKNIYNLIPGKAKVLVDNCKAETKTQIVIKESKEKIDRLLNNEIGSIYYPIEKNFELKNFQMRRMLLDLATYLPGDILAKVDRASMKYSLETRCPLLDYNVLEYSYRLPHEFKYYNGNKKRILKDLVYQYVPKEMLDRPKKGFSVPIEKWLKSNLKEKLNYYTSENFITKQNIFNYTEIEKLKMDFINDIKVYTINNASLLWNILMFQMWYETYIM